MSVLFQHAMRYEWAASNPIRPVRQGALPQQEEIALEPVEVAAILSELRDPVQTLILLAAVTGLRRGELFGLKWEDVDFELEEIRIVRSVVDQVEGPPKTQLRDGQYQCPRSWHWHSRTGANRQAMPRFRLGIRQPSSTRAEALLAGCSPNVTSCQQQNGLAFPSGLAGIRFGVPSQRCFTPLAHP